MKRNSKKDKKERQDSVHALTLLSQIGITMIVTITLPLLLGAFLDRKLGTSPWLLLVLTLLGVLTSFRSLFDITRRHWNRKDDEEALRRIGKTPPPDDEEDDW